MLRRAVWSPRVSGQSDTCSGAGWTWRRPGKVPREGLARGSRHLRSFRGHIVVRPRGEAHGTPARPSARARPRATRAPAARRDHADPAGARIHSDRAREVDGRALHAARHRQPDRLVLRGDVSDRPVLALRRPLPGRLRCAAADPAHRDGGRAARVPDRAQHLRPHGVAALHGNAVHHGRHAARLDVPPVLGLRSAEAGAVAGSESRRAACAHDATGADRLCGRDPRRPRRTGLDAQPRAPRHHARLPRGRAGGGPHGAGGVDPAGEGAM